MACNMLDSMLYRNSYSTPKMREIFDDVAMIQNILDIEAALAETQAEMGLIPKEAAEEIAKKAKAENLDIPRIESEIKRIGHSLVPILKEFQRVCDNNLGEYVHMGATTQDIIDTAFMLSIKRGYEVILADMRETEQNLIALVEKYRDTIMPGRSHTQQALPITFGYKVAVWASEVHRNIERMEECQKRCFVGEMSGAVGSMAGFGPQGLEVCARTIKRLGLDVPDVAWHVSRDRISEICMTLAMMAYTNGKIGNELANLQKTELSEAFEGFVPGSVGSSTMPHKRNPNKLESLQMLAKLTKAAMDANMESMMCENERDGALWKIEWKAAPEVVILAGSSANNVKVVTAHLEVDAAKMRADLDILKGLMQSEGIMLELGKYIGKQTAHGIVYQICMDTFEKKADFCDMLMKNETVAAHMTREQVQKILAPEGYVGLCGEICDQVVAHIRSDNEAKAKA